MPQIATLTLNPAMDLSTAIQRVEPTHKLRCDHPRYDPGGGGINVARVIGNLGGKAVAVYPAGGPFGDMLEHILDTLRVKQSRVPIAGETRESFTVDERETGQQYRFVLPGPVLSDEEQAACLRSLAALDPQPRYLVLSGSFPPGMEQAFLQQLNTLVRQLNARLVVDCSGDALRAVVQQGHIFMLKPSLSELASLVGRSLETRAAQTAALNELLARGVAEAIVLSLGEEGAALATAEGVEFFAAPEVPSVSAVGAGDSMVGATVLALEWGWSLREAVQYGIAAGAATVMLPGTELCQRESVEALFKALNKVNE